MSFIRNFVKSFQQMILTVTAGVNDHVISSVNVSNTILILAGWARSDASGFADGNGSGYITLLDSTHLRTTQTLNSAVAVVNVLEFYSPFLRTPVQYDTIAMSGLSTANKTISAVGSKACVFFLGMNHTADAIQTDMSSQTVNLRLTSSTNVQANRFGTGGVNSPDGAGLSFCVLDPR